MSNHRLHRPPSPPAVAPGPEWKQTIQELRTAEEELRQQYEELQTAEEELRIQNQALVETTHELAAERQRYEELFNFAPDCYLVTDTRGNIRHANRAAGALFGRPTKYFAEKPLRVLIHPDHRRRFDRVLQRLLSGQPANDEKLDLRTRDGVTVPVGVHAHMTGGGDGHVNGILWLLHDLTDLNVVQERAVKAERVAAMGQTVAALAHESRNALQRSQACLRLLALEVQDRPKATEYVERVETALAGLHRLFEDVRLMTTQPRLELQPCDLRALWQEAWEQLEVAREGRNCRLTEEATGVDLACLGDPFRLVQMFCNLFDNALAATPDPVRITVRAAVERMNDHPAVTVDVADNGPGLTAEQRTNVFEPFVTTKPGGMGLGLALVRRIVDAHGGKVEAVDSAGGAVIRVTLLRGGGETLDDSSATHCGC